MSVDDLLALAESGGINDLDATDDVTLNFLAWCDDQGFDIPPTMSAAALVAAWRSEQE